MGTDKTASIGTVCSGSTLFAPILKLVRNGRQLFSADDFSRGHFQITLSVNIFLHKIVNLFLSIGFNVYFCVLN